MAIKVVLLVIALGTTILTCGSPLSVAVENHDDVPYLLRLVDGQHRAWRVPAKTSGIGPTNDGMDTRFVIISSWDCAVIGQFGISTGQHTLVVDGGTMANPDMRSSIDPGIGQLEQIVDPCP